MPFISLHSKPQAKIAYDLFNIHPSQPQISALIVFINGLGLPALSWRPVISHLQASQSITHRLQLLTYDRFSQGATTDPDPLDSQPGKEPGYGHSITNSVADLDELIAAITTLPTQPPSSASLSSKPEPKPQSIILIAASIGVHIARLYTSSHPTQISGLLFLDSNIGNKDFSELWPDPTSPEFDPSMVESEDCTLEDYYGARAFMVGRFNADVKNGEGLDRRNIKDLLPREGEPKLLGRDGRGVWLTVVGHEAEAFVEESWRVSGTPRSLTRRFTNPPWEKYNEGLMMLSTSEKRRGVVIAPGCGHFIQRDNPAFVAGEIERLIGNVVSADGD